MTGTIECDGLRVTVRVINLSEHGVLISGDILPPEDMQVTFRCSGVDTLGWMAWVRPPNAGINFDEPVKLQTAASKPPTAGLIIKDTRKVDFRRPGFRGDQLTAEERAIVEAWQREQLKRDARRSQGQ